MEFTENQIKSFRKILSTEDLSIYSSPQWGSNNPDHKEKIRAALQIQHSESLIYSSVSHCPELGIFVLSKLPVGVDVEISQRVSEKTIGRMATQEELGHSPTPAALWCAKEAAFKALRPFDQPSVMSRISIGSWHNIDSQTDTFLFKNPQEFSAPTANVGLVWKNASLTVSFFIFKA